MAINNKKKNQNDYFINREIKLDESDNVRLITKTSNRVLSFGEALEISEKEELDLILINSSITPPILKLEDYNKFIYEQKKNAKKNKQVAKPVKEIDLSVNIASNDLETKVRHAKSFINDGSKVKVVLTMRGRELSRKDISKQVIVDFISKIGNKIETLHVSDYDFVNERENE